MAPLLEAYRALANGTICAAEAAVAVAARCGRAAHVSHGARRWHATAQLQQLRRREDAAVRRHRTTHSLRSAAMQFQRGSLLSWERGRMLCACAGACCARGCGARVPLPACCIGHSGGTGDAAGNGVGGALGARRRRPRARRAARRRARPLAARHRTRKGAARLAARAAITVGSIEITCYCVAQLCSRAAAWQRVRCSASRSQLQLRQRCALLGRRPQRAAAGCLAASYRGRSMRGTNNNNVRTVSSTRASC